jgi:mannan endo-1,4-beta-mannosidase
MLGHQEDLVYGKTWNGEHGRSDVKESTGKYPAVFGFEIGHLEIGKECTLDTVYFKDIKRCIREAHQMGGIITISWHGNNPATDGDSWDCKSDTVVKSVLPGGVNHEKFLGWLGVLADFFLELKDDNGALIPLIFRPYHEHTGDWFWWGNEQCSPEEYIQLWRMTVEYLRDTRNVHNLLYAYSSSWVKDEADYLERYPGNEYVDIIGFDAYANSEGEKYTDYQTIVDYKHNMKSLLDIVVGFAERAGKIPAITETGMEGFEYEFYFTEALYSVIKDYRISHVLLWRNSPDEPRHYYVAFPGCPNEEDFIKFVNMPEILMLDDIVNIKKVERGPYTLERIFDGIYQIQDYNREHGRGNYTDAKGEQQYNGCSDMYLLVGNEKALLIDLSNNVQWANNAAESLRSLVSEYSHGRDLVITITHEHGDHLGMLHAFANDAKAHFWVPKAEFPQTGFFPKKRTTLFEENASINLGDMVVKTLKVEGHTPGSTLFFVDGRDIVFTGDAIGSGGGVWLFTAESFAPYKQGVTKLINYINDPANNINKEKLIIYSGHTSQVPVWPLGIQYILDMGELIGRMEAGSGYETAPMLYGGSYDLDTDYKYGTATITWSRASEKKYFGR